MEPATKVYPVSKADYLIKEVIGMFPNPSIFCLTLVFPEYYMATLLSTTLITGKGATATVYTALCVPFSETVAVKIINLEQYGANIDEIRVCYGLFQQ